MTSLILLGSIALLWIVIHFYWRARRIKNNAYDRFLRDHTVEDMRVDDLRFMKLRVASLKARERAADGAGPGDVGPPAA